MPSLTLIIKNKPLLLHDDFQNTPVENKPKPKIVQVGACTSLLQYTE